MQRVWSTYLDENARRAAAGSPHLQQQMDPNSPSRRASVANSTLSQAASTRHMLAGMNGPLDPPNAPFIHSASGSSQDSLRADSTSNLSLTVNYLPAKFATSLLSPGARRRKGKGLDVPKRGGGVDAFRTGANRIPGKHDEDDDASGWFSKGKKNMKWTRFKWILFAANILLTIYSITALIFCLLTWFNVWTHADVVRVGNRPELIVSTLASVVGIITSLFGWAGLLLNNRAFLAVYTLFTWITFAMLVIPGYITYRRLTFNLEGKINAEWSRDLGTEGRLRIQNQLGCCGYFSPFVEATISSTCYARSILPGCKLRYLQFERLVLGRWFKVAFAIVPAQLFVMISALLCSNHVTYRFGKGMMPKAYRLSMGSMAVIMDNYANQLAEQYGSDVANDIVNKSRSNLHLDKLGSPSPMVSMPYANNHGTPGYQHTKYDSVGGGGRPAPEGAS